MPHISDHMLNRRLDALNEWLSDVYGDDMHLSQLLSDAYFYDDEIEYIEQERLSEFLQRVLILLDGYPNVGCETRKQIMIDYYGLVDGKRKNFRVMGTRIGLGGARVRQLVHKRLRLYHNPERQAKLRDDFAEIGRQLLKNRRGI